MSKPSNGGSKKQLSSENIFLLSVPSHRRKEHLQTPAHQAMASGAAATPPLIVCREIDPSMSFGAKSSAMLFCEAEQPICRDAVDLSIDSEQADIHSQKATIDFQSSIWDSVSSTNQSSSKRQLSITSFSQDIIHNSVSNRKLIRGKSSKICLNERMSEQVTISSSIVKVLNILKDMCAKNKHLQSCYGGKHKVFKIIAQNAFNSRTIIMYSFYMIVLFSLLINMTNGSSLEFTPVISTRYGQLRGMYQQVSGAGRVATYLGIPYATPPVAANRLSPTRAPSQWRSILDATVLPPACPQNPPKEYRHLLRRQSEDCLYLNLYVPGKLYKVYI